MSITTLVKSVQNIMRIDGDAQRINQMSWMLFLKIFDDKEQEWELTIPNYKSPIHFDFRWYEWATNPKGMTGDELIHFVNNDLFPHLKYLANRIDVDDRGKIVGAVFEDGYNYMKSGTLLRQVINIIQNDVDFNSSKDRHLFNEIYEKILKDLQSAGNAGEYYTPRAVTQFMVDMVNPQIGDSVLDPACGTGGFLTCTIEHLRKLASSPEDEKVLQNSIIGVEKKPMPHLLAITNMLLHGIDVPSNIKHDNTLSKPLRSYLPNERVNCIITNPPFGGMEENGIESHFPKEFQTRETADLFLLLIMHLLKSKGRAALVLPDGTLFGEGVKTRIKEKLLQSCNLHTIVRLPNGVFNPYTGIKTNLLFFTKGESTKEVWYYEHPYPKGCKSYNKTKQMSIEEFEPEKSWWDNRVENEFAWKVSIEELASRNFNLDIKNPNIVDETHGNPQELLKEYKRISQEVSTLRNMLKKELMSALNSSSKKVSPVEEEPFTLTAE